MSDDEELVNEDKIPTQKKPRRSSYDRFEAVPGSIVVTKRGTGEPVQLVRNKNYKGDSKQEKS